MAPSRLIRFAAPQKKEGAPAPVVNAIELKERRRVPRDLPRPEVVESDDDAAWDLWQQSSFPAGASA